MRATIISAVFLLLIAAGDGYSVGIGGQEKAAKPGADEAQARPRADREVEMLALDAQSAPPEFTADLLIRIVESGRVTDPSYKRRLLEDAFRRAGDAQQPVRRAYVGGEVDTRSGYLSYAFDLRLDALSLRCRAIKAMLTLDRRRARELFAEMPDLRLPPLGCDDALVYDVSSFYETLVQVAAGAFSREERKQGEHIRFAAPYLERIDSPSQVGPAAKAILALDPAPPQLAMLAHDFSKALGRIPDDDRSFTYAMTRDSSFAKGLLEVVEACNRRNVQTREVLGEARSYIVRSLGNSRCSDNVPQAAPGTQFGYVSDINKSLNFDPPISADEAKPAEIKTAAKQTSYWKTPEARDLLLRVRKLRFGSGTKPLSDAEKRSTEWQSALTGFIDALHEWDGSREKSQVDYFHQKSVLYRALLELVPDRARREEVLNEYAGFLSDSYAAVDSRIEWLLHAKFLIAQVRAGSGSGRPVAFEQLSGFSNRNLWLYAKADATLSAGLSPAATQQKQPPL